MYVILFEKLVCLFKRSSYVNPLQNPSKDVLHWG